MKLRTYELEKFMEFLMDFDLKAKHCRLRTRFVRLLNEYMERFRVEHKDLIILNSNLDETGQPLAVEKDGVKMYDVVDKVKFNKEFNVLLNEEIFIEINEERKEMFNLIKEIILNCDKTFKYEEAFMYDRFCEIVENVKID